MWIISDCGDNKRPGKRPKKLEKYLNFRFEAKSFGGAALSVAAVEVLESNRAGGTILEFLSEAGGFWWQIITAHIVLRSHPLPFFCRDL